VTERPSKPVTGIPAAGCNEITKVSLLDTEKNCKWINNKLQKKITLNLQITITIHTRDTMSS